MSIYCHAEEEREPFERLYRNFWMPHGHRIAVKSKYKNKKQVIQSSRSTAVMLGTGKAKKDGEAEESKNTSGANAKAIAKKTDFSLLTNQQSELLEEIADKLVREMRLRIKRKRKKAKKGSIHLADSIRKNLQNGGTVINLAHRKPKREKFRLLVLLDVSGSMDKYSFFLLKFLWSLRHHFRQLEAFTFSTQLMRITDLLSDKDLGQALQLVSQNATHWSSGTKIGECLQDFTDNYAQRHLNGNTITIVLSDGLDTGAPEVLETAINKIRLRSKKLVWLNPLKGMQGYEPIQRGMKAALPALSHFGAAHNFDSLLDLENILIHA
ncbi:MAG: VWA domain-containing protein [Lewinella sp.]